jgi:hypothetical protein
MNDVSVVVSQQLDLNMLWLVEETFHEDSSVTKGRFGFRSSTRERVLQVFLFSHDSHTPSTTSVSCLDDDREAIFVCELLHILEFVDCTLSSRNNWYTGLYGYSSSRNFVTERVDDFRGRADELN